MNWLHADYAVNDRYLEAGAGVGLVEQNDPNLVQLMSANCGIWILNVDVPIVPEQSMASADPQVTR